jgi:hypothetical protein
MQYKLAILSAVLILCTVIYAQRISGNAKLLGNITHGDVTSTVSAIPADFFGLHMAVTRSFSGLPMPVAPVKLVNLGKAKVTFWQYLERGRGLYDFSSLDSPMAFATAHSLPFFLSHALMPDWATDAPATCQPASIAGTFNCGGFPSDMNVSAACQAPLLGTTTTGCMWKEFVTTLVRRYNSSATSGSPQTGCSSGTPKCNGVLWMYEGWNEPPYDPQGTLLSASLMAQYETDFYNTVKANDPAAKVCSPAFILNLSFPSYQTFIDNFLSAWNTRNPSGPKFDCYDFHIDATNPEDQIALVNLFKTKLATAGVPSTTPLYATESGRWGDCPVSVTDTVKQAYVGRIEPLYWSLGVRYHWWYAHDTCGTLETSGVLTPLGTAYGNVQDWMTGASMTAPCALASGTTWTCGYTRTAGYKSLQVWDTAGSSSYTPAAGQYTRYRDLDGNVTAYSTGVVTIGIKPILLESGVAPP